MYKILVVDDSILDINCITFLIQKHELPLQITTAVNGQDALMLFQEPNRHFDILFTDIKMPFLDGLELSRKVRRLSPETRIIIFSGFNDFEYAKTAISIGVENYLMKPLVPSDFVDTIQRVILSIEKEQKHRELLQRQNTLVKSHLLWLAINHLQLPGELSSLLEPYCSMILIEFGNEFFSIEGVDFQEQLEHLLSVPFDYLNLYPSRSLLFLKKSLPDAHLLSIAQSISLMTLEQYRKSCYIAFASISDNICLPETYIRLEKQIESRFFFPEQNIFMPTSPGIPAASSGQLSIEILTDDLQLQDYDSFSQHLEEIFDSLEDHRSHSLIYVKYCFTELARVLVKASPANKWDLNALVEKIYGSDNILQLEGLIRQMTQSLGPGKNLSAQKNSLKTEKIQQYIYQNYEKPLTLDEIAAHFYISPNYLCSIFKKETGSSLIKFINDYRLKCAAHLLVSTQMKVHMVADAVGFKNTSYFCLRFRDVYGETPESYRLKNGRG